MFILPGSIRLCPVPGFWSTEVDFLIFLQLILVLVCLQISCTTTKKLTSVLQNPGSAHFQFSLDAIRELMRFLCTYYIFLLPENFNILRNIYIIGSHKTSSGHSTRRARRERTPWNSCTAQSATSSSQTASSRARARCARIRMPEEIR